MSGPNSIGLQKAKMRARRCSWLAITTHSKTDKQIVLRSSTALGLQKQARLPTVRATKQCNLIARTCSADTIMKSRHLS